MASSDSRDQPIRSRLKRVGFIALVLLLVGVILFGATELTVRLLVDGRMDYAIEMWNYARRLKRRARDPLLGHEHVPGTSARLMGVDVKINSHGLRERELGFDKPAGTRRILLLGDSVAFGWGVAFDETMAKRLEAKLNAAGDPWRWEIINSGVGNYNTPMEVQYFLDEGYRYQPDQVILLFVYNDAEETPVYRGNFFTEHLASAVYLSSRIDIALRMVGARDSYSEYYLGLYRGNPVGWQNARAAIGRLGEYCRAHGIQALLANYPFPAGLRRYPFELITEDARQAAAAAQMDFFDLRPALAAEPDESRLWVTPADRHPSGHANGLMADALFQLLHPSKQRVDEGGNR